MRFMDEEKVMRKLIKDLRTGLYVAMIMYLLSKYGTLHGYRIRVLIQEVSGGYLNPSESTIYESLKMMSKLGLVESFWAETGYGPPRKYYKLTDFGMKIWGRLRSELRGFIKIIKEVVGDLGD